MNHLHEKNENILMVTPLNNPAQVQRYAWPGGYEILYIVEDSEVLCAACVEDNIEYCIDKTDSSWYVTAHFINWEDPHMYCGHCNKPLPGEYCEPITD